ncbi:hypothetical protein LX36DRAFT_111067 [Colletotrichum falcatum]|nr:hypothetical protein LX36DRAFT_111067 [Colletotrichum falcatum]
MRCTRFGGQHSARVVGLQFFPHNLRRTINSGVHACSVTHQSRKQGETKSTRPHPPVSCSVSPSSRERSIARRTQASRAEDDTHGTRACGTTRELTRARGVRLGINLRTQSHHTWQLKSIRDRAPKNALIRQPTGEVSSLVGLERPCFSLSRCRVSLNGNARGCYSLPLVASGHIFARVAVMTRSR